MPGCECHHLQRSIAAMRATPDHMLQGMGSCVRLLVGNRPLENSTALQLQWAQQPSADNWRFAKMKRGLTPKTISSAQNGSLANSTTEQKCNGIQTIIGWKLYRTMPSTTHCAIYSSAAMCPNVRKVCPNVPKCAQMCPSVPKCAQVCPSVPKCAQVCPEVPRPPPDSFRVQWIPTVCFR